MKPKRQLVVQLENGLNGLAGPVVASLAEAARALVSDIISAVAKLRRKLNFATKLAAQLGTNGLSGHHAPLHVDAASNRDLSRMFAQKSPTINKLVPVLPFYQKIRI